MASMLLLELQPSGKTIWVPIWPCLETFRGCNVRSMIGSASRSHLVPPNHEQDITTVSDFEELRYAHHGPVHHPYGRPSLQLGVSYAEVLGPRIVPTVTTCPSIQPPQPSALRSSQIVSGVPLAAMVHPSHTRMQVPRQLWNAPALKESHAVDQSCL